MNFEEVVKITKMYKSAIQLYVNTGEFDKKKSFPPFPGGKAICVVKGANMRIPVYCAPIFSTNRLTRLRQDTSCRDQL